MLRGQRNGFYYFTYRMNREGLSGRSHLIRNLRKVREVVKRVSGRQIGAVGYKEVK